MDLALRYRVAVPLANDLGLGWAGYTLDSSTATISGTERVNLLSLSDTMVLFLSPGAPYEPYLLAGPGAWLRLASGQLRPGDPHAMLTPGGKGGAGILIRGDDLGLNLSAVYVLPDIVHPDQAALQYGLALGLGF